MDAFETYQTSKPDEDSPLLGGKEVADVSEAPRRPSTKTLLVAGASLCAVAVVLGHSSASSSASNHNPMVDAQLLQMKIDWKTCIQDPDPKACFDEEWKAKYDWAECLDKPHDYTCWMEHKKKKKHDLALTQLDQELLGSQFSLLDKMAKFDWTECMDSADPHACFKDQWSSYWTDCVNSADPHACFKEKSKKYWPKKKKDHKKDALLEVNLLQMKFNWEKCVASKDPHTCWKEEAKHFWPAGPKHDSDLKMSIIDLGMKMGSYDWMKCLQSTDPNCWADEASKFWPKTKKGSEVVPADLKVSVIDLSVKIGKYDWMKCLQSDDPKCWKDEAKKLHPKKKTKSADAAAVDPAALETQMFNLRGMGQMKAGGYDWMKCLQSDDPKCWKDQAKDLYTKCLDSDDPKCWKNLWGPSMLTTQFGMPDWTDKIGVYDWQKCLASKDPDCWVKEGDRVKDRWTKCLDSDDPMCWKDLWKGPSMLTTQIGMPDLTDKIGVYDWQKCMASKDPDCWMKEGDRVKDHWKNLWKGPSMLTTQLDKSGMPDWDDKRGVYDWQKCLDSKDPDCWKKEGERVGSFWENFGMRMQKFWARVTSFFLGENKEAAADSKAVSDVDDLDWDDYDEDVPLFGRPKHKKHHKKHHKKARKAEASVDETDESADEPEDVDASGDEPEEVDATADEPEEVSGDEGASDEEVDAAAP